MRKLRPLGWLILVSFLLVLVACTGEQSPEDVADKYVLVYEPEPPAPTPDQMEGVLNIIYRRVTLLGIKKATVQRLGDNQIEVQIPADEATGSIDRVKALVARAAKLEFKERTCQTEICSSFADADLGLSGDDLSRAEAATDPIDVGWVVNIEFSDRGTQIFSDLTRRIQNAQTKRIAVFLDGEELVAPVARAWIRDGRTQVSGNFTRDEARTLAIQLESGRLPVALRLFGETVPSQE